MSNFSTRTASAPTETITQTPTGIGQRLLWLGPTGIVVAVALSVVELVLVLGPENNGSVAVALLALLMTAPVVLARRWPITAATVVAAAAVLNGLLGGDIVRCGGAFPAALYIAFAIGARGRENGRGWTWTVAGLAITIAGLMAQWVWDPALNVDSSFLPFAFGLSTLCWAAGIGWSIIADRRRSARRVSQGA